MITFEAPAELAVVSGTIPTDAWRVLLPADHHYVVDVHTVNEDEMRQLNQTTRGLDQPTDVLSFPLYSELSELPDHDAPLGDLFICPTFVDESHLGLRECLIHGTLHLLGFDHETDEPAWTSARAQVKE